MSGIYVCGATAFLIVFGSCLNDFRTIWAGGVCVCVVMMLMMVYVRKFMHPFLR